MPIRPGVVLEVNVGKYGSPMERLGVGILVACPQKVVALRMICTTLLARLFGDHRWFLGTRLVTRKHLLSPGAGMHLDHPVWVSCLEISSYWLG